MRAALWIAGFLARWALNIGAVMLIVKWPPFFWYLPPRTTFAAAAIIGGFSALIARPIGRYTPVVMLLNGWMFWWTTWSGQFHPFLSWVHGDWIHGYLVNTASSAYMAATVYAIATVVTSAVGTRRPPPPELEPSSSSPTSDS